MQKSEFIEILNPEDLKFRPIIAGPSCPTHRLSNVVDILLQPFLKHVNSYVRDDIDYLNHIPSSVPKGVILSTFDVTSLYSNIPHDLGKEAIRYWLEKFPNELHHRFNKSFVLESVDLILNNNTFQFNNTNFIQILGTAMGTKMAPVYANLTLGFLEKYLYQDVNTNFPNIDENIFINSWKRYIDDCIILWDPNWGDINKLHTILQNIHPNIKFTMECSDKEIPFLDILLKINGQVISTDIYRKPTDTQQYLHFKSQHPKTCLKAIPYNLARRICTIVSDLKLRDTRLNELRTALLQRAFPISLINKGIELAKQIPLSELRKVKEKKSSDVLTFVTTFNKCNPEIFNEAYKNLNQLRMSERMENILNETKLVKSKRQPKNLKKILTCAKFEMNDDSTLEGVSRCKNKRCKICDILIEGRNFKFKHSASNFEIKRNLTCTSKNVVYVLQCDNCKEEYIGSTKQLNHRISLHKSNIKLPQNRILFVSRHIFDCSEGNFKVMPIYQTDDYSMITIKEQLFIDRYKPMLNRT